jgi:hypothetical protein
MLNDSPFKIQNCSKGGWRGMKNLFAGMAKAFSRRVGKDSPCPPIAVPRGQMKPAHPTFFLLLAFFILSFALILPNLLHAEILNNYRHITGANQ